MKNIKTTALFFAIGLLSITISLGQSAQIFDNDNEITTLQKALESPDLSVEEQRVLVKNLNALLKEREVPFRSIQSLLLITSIDELVKNMSKLVLTEKLSEFEFKIIIEELNKKYDFYSELIKNGYDDKSALSVKVKEINGNTNMANAEFEKFKSEYKLWVKNSNLKDEMNNGPHDK